jgi:hypothetical protein
MGTKTKHSYDFGGQTGSLPGKGKRNGAKRKALGKSRDKKVTVKVKVGG